MNKFFQQKILLAGVFLFLPLFTTSCAEDKFQEEARAGFLAEQQALKDENLALWEDQGITDYRFSFNWSCFCSPTFIQKVEITVVGGVIASVTVIETGEVLTDDIILEFDYRTVEGLFDWIEEGIKSGPYLMAVSYDPDRGFPESAYLDLSAAVADEEKAFFVFNLEEILP